MNPLHWLYAGIASIAVAFALKKLPDLIASQENKLLGDLLSAHDSDDDELILAMVKWADKKIPGGQQGHLKYQAVANLISARFPLISPDKLDELIETTVDKVKAQAENIAAAPPAPSIAPKA